MCNPQRLPRPCAGVFFWVESCRMHHRREGALKLWVVTVALIATAALSGCASAPPGADARSSVSLYGTVDLGIGTVRSSRD